MTDRNPPPLADRYRAASGALGVGAAVVGAGVMVGWLVGLPRLTDWHETLPEAKFNAGACVFLLGITLWLLHHEKPSRRRRLTAHACAACAAAIALLSIGEIVLGWDLGIDNLVVREPAGALGALAPGRMALHAALMFVLVGAALLLLDQRTLGGRRLSRALSAAAAIATLFVAEGYAYGVRFFWGPGQFAYTALPIVAGLIALSLGLLAARPEGGVVSVLLSPEAGGRIARRLLPVVVVAPLVLGALQVAAVAWGLATEPFALAAAMSALIAISAWVVLTTSRTIEKREASEAAALDGQRAAERRLLDALDNLAMFAVELNARGTVTYANDHLLRATGWTREEVVGHDWFDRFDRGRPEVRDVFRRGLAEGLIPAHHENPVWTRAGTTLLLSWNNTTLRDASGMVASTLSIGEDVTVRRAAEIAVRESERRLDEIVRAVPFGAHLYELQPDGRLVLTGASPSAERILHLDHAPLIGKTLEEAFPGNVGTDVPDAYRRVATTGESWSKEQLTYDDGRIAGAFDVRAVNTGPGRLAAFFADITERKRVEEELVVIRKAVESTSDAVGISNAQGHHIYQNRALSDLFGYATAEELESAGGGPAAVRDPAVAKEMFERIMSGGSWAGELEMVTKSGRVFPAYERADAIVGSDGHLVGLIGIITDITERKRAESLAQARVRLTDFAASHALGELLQYALDQVCAQVDSPLGFFHFVEADQHTLSLQAWSTGTRAGLCTAEGSGRHYDIGEAGVWVDCVRQRRPVVHNDYAGLAHKKGMPNGHATVVREMVFPIVRDEKLVAIIGTGNKPRDYTDDDVAQASRLADLAWDIVARKRAEEALRDSENRYAVTLDAVNDGLWDWNVPSGNAVFGPRYYALLGYEDGEFAANYATWRLLVHPEDLDQVEEQLGLSVASGEGFTIDFRMKVKSGAWRWVSTRGRVVERDAAGRAVRLVGTLSDITERKRAEEALRDLNATLERRVADRTAELTAAVKELEAFSYSVSHDLRAPLRSIDGFSRILLDEFAPTLAPAAQRYLGLVRTNAQQMGQLVDDLLAFSRLGRQPLRRTRVEPAEVVRACLRDLEPEFGALVGTVTVGPLAPCHADPALLRQVWMNLLANACKFTRQRDRAEIRVGCRDEGGTTVYVVSDNGVGFDMAYVDKLFGVFQRLHRAEDYEGTGVGLALVQRIVHRHGGRIWAEAAADRGATFYFTLGEEAADGPHGS